MYLSMRHLRTRLKIPDRHYIALKKTSRRCNLLQGGNRHWGRMQLWKHQPAYLDSIYFDPSRHQTMHHRRWTYPRIYDHYHNHRARPLKGNPSPRDYPCQMENIVLRLLGDGVVSPSRIPARDIGGVWLGYSEIRCLWTGRLKVSVSADVKDHSKGPGRNNQLTRHEERDNSQWRRNRTSLSHTRRGQDRCYLRQVASATECI